VNIRAVEDRPQLVRSQVSVFAGDGGGGDAGEGGVPAGLTAKYVGSVIAEQLIARPAV
jgi:hypothetical protein